VARPRKRRLPGLPNAAAKLAALTGSTLTGAVLLVTGALLLAIGAVLIGGCTQGPDYARPDLGDITAPEYAGTRDTDTQETAGAASDSLAAAAAASLADSTGLVQSAWWEAFDDTTLNRLVDDALRYNNNLSEAVGRVLEARALHGGASSARWPTIGIGASAARSKSVLNTPAGPTEFYSTQYQAVATFRYELDLWGRLSRSEQAAYATLLSSEMSRRTVAQTLIADVVRTWLEIREREAQLALTERTIANFEENLSLVEDRYLRGLVSALDLRLSRQNLATALAVRPQDQQALATARRRLEILVGRYPSGTIVASAAGYDPAHLPDPLPPVPAGLPSSLLERRPDLIAAEFQLASATARIGEAKAALFPRIGLTADGGTGSADLGDLLTSGGGIWSLVANLTMPLINRGQTKAQIRAAEARTAQAVSAYRGALLNAFREVESALDLEYYQRQSVEQLRISADEARRALRLAEERYSRGLDNLLFILDSQRRLFNSETALLATERAYRTARVNLILALGGPWDLDAVPLENQPLAGDERAEETVTKVTQTTQVTQNATAGDGAAQPEEMLDE